jgi:DNA-binding GntR family transcriptional regulator
MPPTKFHETDDPRTSRSSVDLTYEAIMDMVVGGEFRPGDIVQERRLALRLGVSRTPVREALSRLEGERIFERRDDGVLAVRQMTVEGLMEVLHVRRLLEADAAARAAGKIPLDRIVALEVRIATLLAGGDPSAPDHAKINSDLHEMIAEHCGNALMVQMLATLRRSTGMFSMKRIPSRFGPASQEHMAILDALRRGDSEAAAEATRAHVDAARQSIIDKLTSI